MDSTFGTKLATKVGTLKGEKYHNYMYKIVWTVLLSATFFACQNLHNASFSADGVSFVLPNMWTIETIDSLGGSGFYVSCEKDTPDQYAFISFTILDGESEPTDAITAQEEAVRENPFFLQWRTRFIPPQTAQFAGFPAMKGGYYTTNADKNIRADVYCFVCGGKTLTFLQQGLLQDSLQHAQNRQDIEQQFKCQ